MPFYEYRRADGSTFEVMQKMTDPPLTEDPETGAPIVRVFHPIAVHFKGKGFYNTDYGTRRRNAEKAAEGASSAEGADKKPEGATAKKSESASSSSSSSSTSSSPD